MGEGLRRGLLGAAGSDSALSPQRRQLSGGWP